MRLMKKTFRLLLAGALLFALAGTGAWAAATWVLRGTVTDATTQQPIKDAVITLKGLAMGRVYTIKTNKKGEYLIRIPLGEFHLTLKKDGYVPQELPKIKHPMEGDARVEDFQMQPGKGVLESELTPEQREKMRKEQEEFEKNKEKIEEIKKMTGKMKKLFEDAVALKAAGQYDEAIAKLNEALELDANQPNILGHLADAYFLKGDYDKAIEYYQKAIALSPTEANLHTNLGNVYVKKGMIPEAQAEFEKAIQADPTHADLNYYNMGVVMLNAGKTQEALTAFDKSVKTNPAYGPAYYQLAMCLVNTGKYKDAVTAMEKYLELEPNGQYAGQAKQMLPLLKQQVGG